MSCPLSSGITACARPRRCIALAFPEMPNKTERSPAISPKRVVRTHVDQTSLRHHDVSLARCPHACPRSVPKSTRHSFCSLSCVCSIRQVSMIHGELTIGGGTNVRHRWSWKACRELPTENITVDIHCVTRWSKLGTMWGRVGAQVRQQVCRVRAHSRSRTRMAGYGSCRLAAPAGPRRYHCHGGGKLRQSIRPT